MAGEVSFSILPTSLSPSYSEIPAQRHCHASKLAVHSFVTMHSSSILSFLTFASVSFAAQVKFTLNVTWAESSLVGTPKKQFLINGQSPGPALNLNVGDEVTVDLINNSPYNTTVHFHGITQLGTVSEYSLDVLKSYLHYEAMVRRCSGCFAIPYRVRQ
jgi:Multicopper oxidase